MAKAKKKEPEKFITYFEQLNNIDVSKKVEKKGQLSYLSWAWAWGELKKLHPDAQYTVYETEQGVNYWNDGRTAWVKTGVTIELRTEEGFFPFEHIEYLPIMDYRNNSIPLEKITSKDVNTAIQRSITKAIARHGLGLYIYAGEDLPETVKGMPRLSTPTDKEETLGNALKIEDEDFDKEKAIEIYEAADNLLDQVEAQEGLDTWKKAYGSKVKKFCSTYQIEATGKKFKLKEAEIANNLMDTGGKL